MSDGTEQDQGAGGEGQGQDQPKESVFDRLRGELQEGKRIFPTTDEPEGTIETDEEFVIEAEAPEGEELDEAEEELEAGQELEEEEPEGEGEAEEPTGEEEDEGEEGEGGLVVSLPGRNAGEEFEIEAGDQETADALNRLRKGYLRREALHAERERLQADRDEIEEIDTALAADPAGFILDKVAPQTRVEVARALITDDAVWEALSEEIIEAEDPDRREVIRLKSNEERREKAEERRTKYQRVKATREAVREIGNQVKDMARQVDDGERAARFINAALGVAEELVTRSKRLDITREELVTELSREGLLDRFGISPEARPASKGAGAGTSRGSARSSTSASKNGQGSEGKGRGAQTAEELKKARKRRRAVAASAPAGAGSPTASVELAQSNSVKERIKDVRKMGLAAAIKARKS